MSRTSGARFPDPPEGGEEPKRYRVPVLVSQVLYFDVTAWDEDDAIDEAKHAYKTGLSPASQTVFTIDDYGPVTEVDSTRKAVADLTKEAEDLGFKY